jgi:hypothetical protein
MEFQGLNERSKRHHSSAPPYDWLRTPSASGGWASVGVSQASYLSKNGAIARVAAWMLSTA